MNNKSVIKLGTLALVTAVGLSANVANAAAVRAGFSGSTLARNDDLSTGFVGFGFSGAVDFFGVSYSGGFVNNNGNMTFGGPLGTFTPFPIISTGTPMLAPFFGDVDTRNAAIGLPVTYGTGTVGGRDAFGVNWVDVGYFSATAATNNGNTNSFQLVIIERFDTGPGNFDFEFNYDRILWEAGQASGSDVNGLGGFSARAGWSNGTTDSVELAGSGINGAFLDSNLISGLIHNSLDSGLDGRYVWSVRNGVVQVIPLPTPGLLAAAGLMGIAAGRRRRN